MGMFEHMEVKIDLYHLKVLIDDIERKQEINERYQDEIDRNTNLVNEVYKLRDEKSRDQFELNRSREAERIAGAKFYEQVEINNRLARDNSRLKEILTKYIDAWCEIHLVGFGGEKINAIKAVREVTFTSLKFAKDLVESSVDGPVVILDHLLPDEAQVIYKKVQDLAPGAVWLLRTLSSKPIE